MAEHVEHERERVERERERVEREQLIPAPPDQVWQVITSDGWLADEVRLELKPGGDAHFSWAEATREGWVEEAVASERLIFWWADDGEPASRVELTLEPEGVAATRLRVLEARPLEVLDVIGLPLPGSSGADPGLGVNQGPVLLAA